jgi:hypothetical protein
MLVSWAEVLPIRRRRGRRQWTGLSDLPWACEKNRGERTREEVGEP